MTRPDDDTPTSPFARPQRRWPSIERQEYRRGRRQTIVLMCSVVIAIVTWTVLIGRGCV